MIEIPGNSAADAVVASGGVGRRGEEAYAHLRTGILCGDYPVGSVVTDTKVAAALGMSKTPVRDALKRLEQEGLLGRGPRRQFVVKGFSPELRREIVSVREALERLAVRRAAT